MMTRNTLEDHRALRWRARLAKALHRWVDVYVSPLPALPPASVREAKRLARARRRLAKRLASSLDESKIGPPNENH